MNTSTIHAGMSNESMPRSAHVVRMIELIDRGPDADLSLGALARVLGRQEAYLGRLFRQQVGTSVRDYIARVRMDRAADLIRQGEKVEAVALEVGYRSKKNFYRQFKQRFGTTPAVYRIRGARDRRERDVDPALLLGLRFRSLGPAISGGRILALAVVAARPSTFYVGAACGGIWKTVNNGTTWQPVFENERAAAIGALAVAPSDAEAVWAGTGESDSQSSPRGDGVYRSTDGGRTWTNAGLRDSQHISRILVDTEDPGVAYVAASGHLAVPNHDGGVFKTTDGGRTWTNVLFVNGETGATDIVMAPISRHVLIAATRERRARESGITASGTGSALYKTENGGRTWRKLTNGLPAGGAGHVSLCACAQTPHVVYTWIESAAEGGIFRSDDWGETWRRVSTLNPRPDLGEIRVDPGDARRVYVLGEDLHASDDGAETFSEDIRTRGASEHRAMWIDGADPQHLIVGTDAGVCISYDRGRTWQCCRNLPIGQFSSVSVDMRSPYFVYGALRNGRAWAGPSATRHVDGVLNDDWFAIPGGARATLVDPTDSNILYARESDGRVVRLDSATGEHKFICPALPEPGPRPPDGEPPSPAGPILISPHHASTIYAAGDRVFKSTDRGDSWHAISPDLRASLNGKPPRSVTALAESARTPGLLYAGTSAGTIHVTRDGGKTWVNATATIPGVPRDTRVTCLSTSGHEAATAYVAFEGDQTDTIPYVFTTTDAGRSWKSVAATLPGGPVRVVREDPRNPDLLYAGTDIGLFVSWDRGGGWTRLNSNLPTVPVSDVLVHPRDNDLVLATLGRGIWLLDDATPLQDFAQTASSPRAYLFGVRPASQFTQSVARAPLDSGVFAALNPAPGAIITYYLKNPPTDGVRLSITDATGAVVRELNGGAVPGVNRMSWDLRLPPPRDAGDADAGVPEEGLLAAFVAPGEYHVSLIVDAVICGTRAIAVHGDPLIEISDAARREQRRAVTVLTNMHGGIGALLTLLSRLCADLRQTSHTIDQQRSDRTGAVKSTGRGLAHVLAELQQMALYADEESSLGAGAEGEVSIEQPAGTQLPLFSDGFPNGRLRGRISRLMRDIGGSTSAPTASQSRELMRLQEELGSLISRVNDVVERRIQAINRVLESRQMVTIPHPAPLLLPMLIDLTK